MLIAILLIAVIGAGAYAVDISMQERRASKLQGAADAAALAAASTWAESGDRASTEAIVADVLTQNGITISSTLEVSVTYPDDLTVDVELTDTGLRRLLGAFADGNPSITRGAASGVTQIPDCEGCPEGTVPPPLATTTFRIRGWGMQPIMVGTRVYVLPELGTYMGCYDRLTEEECWPFSQSRRLSNYRGARTLTVTQPYVYDEKIYFVAFDGSVLNRRILQGGSFVFGCFDTTTNSPCPDEIVLGRMSAGMHGTQNGMYVFASDLKVYCWMPETLDPCPGYISPRSSALDGYRIAAEGYPEQGESLSEHDMRAINAMTLELNGKIWTTASMTGGGQFLHCWDTNIDAPCVGFGVKEFVNGDNNGYPSDDAGSGKLAFHRDASGTPTAICSFGLGATDDPTDPRQIPGERVECWDMDTGAVHHAAQSVPWNYDPAITGVAIPDGYPIYHAATNRLIKTSYPATAETWCFDFNTQSGCGVVVKQADGANISLMQWIAEGDCLYGVNWGIPIYQSSSLWSGRVFTAADINDIAGDNCNYGTRALPVDAADCEGGLLTVGIEHTDNVASAGARVLTEDGSVIAPASGSGFVDVLDGPVLVAVAPTLGRLSVELQVGPNGSGPSPWDEAPYPKLVAGCGSTTGAPRLTD